MANIHKILSVEIRRLAKKEVKTALDPLKTQILQLRKLVLLQKRQIKALQAASGLEPVEEPAAPALASPEPAAKKYRVSSERIKKIRKKIGVSQTVFAKLLGVSLKTVVNWESGSVKPREHVKPKLVALAKMGKRELAVRLANVKKAAKPAVKMAVKNAEPAVDEVKEDNEEI